jgi:hypothetical protein
MVPAVDIKARYPSRLHQSQGWLVGGLGDGSVEVRQGAQRVVQRARRFTRRYSACGMGQGFDVGEDGAAGSLEAVDTVGGRIAVSGGVEDR